jgi:hypothetical protein
MFCNACGTRVSDSERHCPNCGRGLKSAGAGSSSPKGKAASSSQSLSPSSARMPSLGKASQGSKPVAKGKARPADRPADSKAAVSKSSTAAVMESAAAAVTESAGCGAPEIRSMLWKNPEKLEPGLSVYKDPKGKSVGIRFECEVGEIDLLACDDSGGLVVVMVSDDEVTKGKELVSDALERVGWVRLEVAKSGQEVRAIVLTGSVPDDLSYAAAAVAGTVAFKTYCLVVSFEDVIV